MHSVVVIAQGLVLLAVFLLVARLIAGAASGEVPRRIYAACKIFIALWLVCAIFNLWRGVTEAGYTVIDELPFFVLVFGIPATAAAVIGHRALKRIAL